MIKIILSIIVVIATTYCGIRLSDSYKKRQAELTLVAQMLSKIIIELEYARTPTDEIIDKLSSLHNFNNLCFLTKCNALMKNGTPFKLAFIKGLDEATALNKDDILLLKELGEILGQYDVNGQISSIKAMQHQLQLQIDDATNEYIKNGKLYRSLGILGGLALVIIIY